MALAHQVLGNLNGAGNEEPTDETPGGADEVPTDADGNPLGPESAGGPAKGEGKAGDDVAGDENLSKAGSCGRSDLGSISAKYESNGKPGAIGRDSTGGYSYGSYQIATKTGTMGTFMNYLKKEQKYSNIYTSLNNAGGNSGATSGSSHLKINGKILQLMILVLNKHNMISYKEHTTILQ